jgi:hypothetical protein
VAVRHAHPAGLVPRSSARPSRDASPSAPLLGQRHLLLSLWGRIVQAWKLGDFEGLRQRVGLGRDSKGANTSSHSEGSTGMRSLRLALKTLVWFVKQGMLGRELCLQRYLKDSPGGMATLLLRAPFHS